MKHLISLLFALTLTFSYANAQSSIVTLTVTPANPNIYDTIYISADLQFPSSGCVLDNKIHSLIGNTISASTMHCLGNLSMICNITDVFKIDPLAAGTYTFSLTLSSGYGGPPCSPGIVPDDNDTVSFVVSYPVGIKESQKESIEIFPNPVSDILTISKNEEPIQQLIITSFNGAIILKLIEPNDEIDISDLPNGIYLLQLHYKEGIKLLKFIKE